MNKHIRDRKVQTCNKLACMQTMGGGGIVRALMDITIHQHISSKV